MMDEEDKKKDRKVEVDEGDEEEYGGVASEKKQKFDIISFL